MYAAEGVICFGGGGLVNRSHPSATYSVAHTGTIDPYSCTWSTDALQYIKQQYKYPCVLKGDAPKKAWIHHSRIIFAGMALTIEGFPDPKQEYLAAKSTVVATFSNEDELFYVQALLSSSLLCEFYRDEFSAEAMAGGYLNFTAAKLGEMPYINYDPLQNQHRDISNLGRQLFKVVSHRDGLLAAAKRFLDSSYDYRPPRGHGKDFLHLPFSTNARRLKVSLNLNEKMQLQTWFDEQSAVLRLADRAVDASYSQLNQLVEDLFSA